MSTSSRAPHAPRRRAPARQARRPARPVRGRRALDRRRRRAARRRRRGQRARPPAQRPARRARRTRARAEGGRSPGSARSSRAPRRTCGSSDEAATKLGLVQPIRTRRRTCALDSRERPAREPPDPPARPRLRPALRRRPRAGGLDPGRRRRRLRGDGRRGSTARRSRSRPGAARSSTARATPLAIGEQATTVYADPRTSPTRDGCGQAGDDARPRPERALPDAHATGRSGSSTCTARPTRSRRRRSQKHGVPGLGFYPEERRVVPAGRGRRARARVRGHRQQRSRRARALARQDAARPARASRSSSRTRSAARSTSSRRGRSGRAGTSSSRSTTRSRRPPSRCSPTASAAGGAKGATAIVMDPRTGAILAMANAPTFDANRFADAAAETRRNRAVTDLYEPGSTFKIVTIAAALEDGIVAPTTSFLLAPTIQVADRVDPRGAHARHGADDRAPDPRRLLERRHGHDRAAARRPGARLVDRPLRVRRDDRASTSRARARAWCSRSSSGRARRSARCRSARASR